MNKLIDWMEKYPDWYLNLTVQIDYINAYLWKQIKGKRFEHVARISTELINCSDLDWETLVITELERSINEGSNPSPR